MTDQRLRLCQTNDGLFAVPSRPASLVSAAGSFFFFPPVGRIDCRIADLISLPGQDLLAGMLEMPDQASPSPPAQV
jgi:hypothetical protein